MSCSLRRYDCAFKRHMRTTVDQNPYNLQSRTGWRSNIQCAPQRRAVWTHMSQSTNVMLEVYANATDVPIQYCEGRSSCRCSNSRVAHDDGDSKDSNVPVDVDVIRIISRLSACFWVPPVSILLTLGSPSTFLSYQRHSHNHHQSKQARHGNRRMNRVPAASLL